MKTIIVAFGRMNPVTHGHNILVSEMRRVAKTRNADIRLYLSHTQGPKDPLSYNDKAKYAKQAFGSVMHKSAAKTVSEMFKELQKDGYTDVVLVAGGTDQVANMTTMVARMQDKFDSLKIHSAGSRADGGESGAKGVSASRMRAAAKSGDVATFKQQAHTNLTDKSLRAIYKTISGKEMNMSEETQLDEGMLQTFIQKIESIGRFRNELAYQKHLQKDAAKMGMKWQDVDRKLELMGKKKNLFKKEEIEGGEGDGITEVTTAQRIKTSLKRGRMMRKGTAQSRKMARGKKIIKNKRGKQLSNAGKNARRSEVKIQRSRLTGGSAIKSGAGGVAKRVRSSTLFSKSSGAQSRAARGTKPRTRANRRRIMSNSFDAMIDKSNKHSIPIHEIAAAFELSWDNYEVNENYTQEQYAFQGVNSYIANTLFEKQEFVSNAGAGEEGSDKLKKTYAKDVPGQDPETEDMYQKESFVSVIKRIQGTK